MIPVIMVLFSTTSLPECSLCLEIQISSPGYSLHSLEHLLIPLVYCIYRIGYIDKKQTLFAALLLALSPDMVYFSRFLRHDIFMLFFTFLLLVAILYYFEYGQTRFAIIAAIAMAGGLSAKRRCRLSFLSLHHSSSMRYGGENSNFLTTGNMIAFKEHSSSLRS